VPITWKGVATHSQGGSHCHRGDATHLEGGDQSLGGGVPLTCRGMLLTWRGGTTREDRHLFGLEVYVVT